MLFKLAVNLSSVQELVVLVGDGATASAAAAAAVAETKGYCSPTYLLSNHACQVEAYSVQ
jgi:hypothetical protein